jgi:hypothetical protein
MQPAALAIRVVNGNLLFVPQPLVLGHYDSIALTGSERVMDRLLDGAMQVALDLGRYPDLPGSAEVFVNRGLNQDNPLQPPRPAAVIVVGLGDEGSLVPSDLAHTVCQGVLAWVQRRGDGGAAADGPFDLAATLLGSGGAGMNAGESARQVAAGVLEANQRLVSSKRPGVRQLDFVELYLDRATEAWRALREQETAHPARWRLHPVIDTGSGALRRPLEASYRGTTYDLISARTARAADGSQAIAFVLDTRRARTEVHAHATQVPLLRELVGSGASSRNRDVRIGRTLFRLLVPVELETFFAGGSETLIQVDGGTAGIPWEMLDPGEEGPAGGVAPWAIRAKLLRKLQTTAFRPRVVPASGDLLALVIGEPACDGSLYPRLPSAHAEASQVAELLQGDGQVRKVFSPDPQGVGPSAREVINALLEQPWRIVHITGHGEPPEELEGTASGGPPGPPLRRRGVVLSGGVFLGPDEIRGMRVVPDLVFVNCCHLARRSTGELLDERGLRALDRPRFAGTLAESLIGLGVRCVIAAGWAVEDDAASAFAATFYRCLIGGSRFIDAVAAARQAARDLGGNTWAAYQCYGDPDWRLRGAADASAAQATDPARAYAQVASSEALKLALETLIVNAPTSHEGRARLAADLHHLEKEFAGRWGTIGSVAEAFGAAWKACDRGVAIDWYRRALSASDGSASLHAAEDLGNLRARDAAELVADPARRGPDQAAAVARARIEIKEALELLQRVCAVQPNPERESLCGSAWKRLAMVEAMAEDRDRESQAIGAMRDCYARAERLARLNADPTLFYPALNGMAAELIVDLERPGWAGFDADRLAEVRASLLARTQADPDFWSFAGLIELRLYEALSRSRLAAESAAIETAYADLHRRVSAPWLWASHRDQLRFVLSARRSLPEAERRAGQQLLAQLETFAAG